MGLIGKLLSRNKENIKDGDVSFVVDDRSMAECIADELRSIDPNPKHEIEIVSSCPCLPWIWIEGGKYFINGSRAYRGNNSEEAHAFMVAFKGARLMAQLENPNLVLFPPGFRTGNAILDSKLADIYFDEIDAKIIDADVLAYLVVATVWLDDFPPEEIAKLVKIGSDQFMKAGFDRKGKKIYI